VVDVSTIINKAGSPKCLVDRCQWYKYRWSQVFWIPLRCSWFPSIFIVLSSVTQALLTPIFVYGLTSITRALSLFDPYHAQWAQKIQKWTSFWRQNGFPGNRLKNHPNTFKMLKNSVFSKKFHWKIYFEAVRANFKNFDFSLYKHSQNLLYKPSQNVQNHLKTSNRLKTIQNHPKGQKIWDRFMCFS